MYIDNNYSLMQGWVSKYYLSEDKKELETERKEGEKKEVKNK